jgi:hypothetical protein
MTGWLSHVFLTNVSFLESLFICLPEGIFQHGQYLPSSEKKIPLLRPFLGLKRAFFRKATEV